MKKMKTQTVKEEEYFFTLHDCGGRVIELYSCEAVSYEAAYASANVRARSIHSHGITRCDSRWRPA